MCALNAIVVSVVLGLCVPLILLYRLLFLVLCALNAIVLCVVLGLCVPLMVL